MILEIKNLITKIVNCIKFKIIYLILFLFVLIFCGKIYSKEINFETELAIKYCDSIDKNLFKGLDNEKILKYEYFFNSISKDLIDNSPDMFLKFEEKVKQICNYKLNTNEKFEIGKLLKEFEDNIK